MLDQSLDGARTLLEHGADPNSIDDEIACQIRYTIRDQTTFALLLCVFCQGFNQWQPGRFVPTAKLLLEYGANLHAPLNKSQTLIRHVFENVDYKVVKVFLDCAYTIKFEVRDQRQRTILLAACGWTETLPGCKH